MSIDLVDIMKKIIGVDELKNFPAVESKLAEYEEGYIFQNNKPTHVIMTLEKYESIEDGMSESETADTSSEGVDSLLNKIGKKIFVDYYDIFKADNTPEISLEKEGFTLASRRSRSSSARSIFKNGLQIAALNNIISSGRIDVETVNKATILLARENGYSASAPEVDDEEEEQYNVKIGKMMRGVMTKLLQNHILTEEELAQLQTDEYSKSAFNLNFPVIKVISSGQTLDEAKRDTKGYNRYYDSAVNMNGKQYLICSQWVDNLHKDKVETWIIDKMADIVVVIAAGIPMGDEFNVREILSDYWPHIDWSVRKRIGKKYKLIIKDDLSVECVSEKKHGKIYRKVQ